MEAKILAIILIAVMATATISSVLTAVAFSSIIQSQLTPQNIIFSFSEELNGAIVDCSQDQKEESLKIVFGQETLYCQVIT